MENNQLICQACGSDSFTKGEIGRQSGHATIRPLGAVFSLGSPLIYTFCKNCGEVASIKVEHPKKFK